MLKNAAPSHVICISQYQQVDRAIELCSKQHIRAKDLEAAGGNGFKATFTSLEMVYAVSGNASMENTTHFHRLDFDL